MSRERNLKFIARRNNIGTRTVVRTAPLDIRAIPEFQAGDLESVPEHATKFGKPFVVRNGGVDAWGLVPSSRNPLGKLVNVHPNAKINCIRIDKGVAVGQFRPGMPESVTELEMTLREFSKILSQWNDHADAAIYGKTISLPEAVA